VRALAAGPVDAALLRAVDVFEGAPLACAVGAALERTAAPRGDAACRGAGAADAFDRAGAFAAAAAGAGRAELAGVL
jgi:hypothetical protein